MSEIKQAGHKASLAEQGSFSRAQAEKERVWTLEARSGDMGGLQKFCLPLQGENLCRQSSIKVETGQCCGGQQKKGCLSVLAKGETEMTLVHYLVRLITSQIGTQTKQRCLMPSLSVFDTNDGPWDSGTLSWRTMTARNSLQTLTYAVGFAAQAKRT